MPRDSFCSYCGAPFGEVTGYPRTCSACRTQIWANPIPVAVVLLPLVDGGRTGLLVVRRSIPPVGKLALVGGFIEDHEPWQVCAARELREEANIEIDPGTLEPLWYASSEPAPNRVLLFSVAPAIEVDRLPPFVPNTEASERGVLFRGGEAELAFPLHIEAARRYFGHQPSGGPGYVVR